MTQMEIVISHFLSMGKLEGRATDYPIMLCVYLGIFLFCVISCITLCVSKVHRVNFTAKLGKISEGCKYFCHKCLLQMCEWGC